MQSELLELCVAKGIPIMADEVYQENVWQECKSFTSFRKVALDRKLPATLFSLHSISKGFLGECGHRGGYLDVLNVAQQVLVQMKKLMSISLCSNTVGQLLVAAMMTPPRDGEASYALYEAEKGAVLASLKRRAKQLVEGLRTLEGVTCALPPVLARCSCAWGFRGTSQGAANCGTRTASKSDFFVSRMNELVLCLDRAAASSCN